MSRYILPKILSFTDIATLEVCKGGACSNLPFKQLLKIAYEHGLDVCRSYSIREGMHRTLSCGVIDGEYIVAEERLDKAWIDSGYATLEAIMQSTEDSSMISEMRKMNGGDRSLEQYGK